MMNDKELMKRLVKKAGSINQAAKLLNISSRYTRAILRGEQKPSYHLRIYMMLKLGELTSLPPGARDG